MSPSSPSSVAGTAPCSSRPLFTVSPAVNIVGLPGTKRYLIWFSHHNTYYNMRFQELESLAEMAGVSTTGLYGFAPNTIAPDGGPSPDSRPSLPPYPLRPTQLDEEPYVFVFLPDLSEHPEILTSITQRAVLIKYMMEVWGEGSCWEACGRDMESRTGLEVRREVLNEERSFCFRPLAFGCSLTQERKTEAIRFFERKVLGEVVEVLVGSEQEESSIQKVQSPAGDSREDAAAEQSLEEVPSGSEPAAKRRRLNPKGINIADPDSCLLIFEDYGVEDEIHKKDRPLRKVFLGLEVTPRLLALSRGALPGAAGTGSLPGSNLKPSGKKKKALPFVERYALSKRCVLGPTTMDNELAFLMANMAQCRKFALALDPFSGTGAILLTMAHFGSCVVGNDIDIRVLKGWRIAYQKNKTECRRLNAIRKCDKDSKDIYLNFYQYGLRRPEIVVADNTRSPWRTVSSSPSTVGPVVAGVAAVQEKTPSPEQEDPAKSITPGGWLDCIVTDPPYGIRAASKRVKDDGQREVYDRSNYIPAKDEYVGDAVLVDLLQFAAEALVDGGRLTFLLPIDLVSLKERGEVSTNSLRDLILPHGNGDKNRGATTTPGLSEREVLAPRGGEKTEDVDPASDTRSGVVTPGDSTVTSSSSCAVPSSSAPSVNTTTVLETSTTTVETTSNPEKNKKIGKSGREWFSSTTRDALVLDEKKYVIPEQAGLEKVSASLQVLSGGLGRLLVTMRRVPRGDVHRAKV